METTQLNPIYLDLRKSSRAPALNPAARNRMEQIRQPVQIDQRSRVRFPIQLRVFYRTLARRHSYEGMGWIVNMSSAGVLVASELDLRAGTRMELNVDWPAKLDGKISLQLVAVGKVVRCETSGFAVSLVRYQFRTKCSTAETLLTDALMNRTVGARNKKDHAFSVAAP